MMSDAESNPTRSGASLDQARWEAECAFREREVAVREREQQSKDAHLALAQAEHAASRWKNPLVVAILAATVAAIGSAFVAYTNAKSQRNLETQKSEQARILAMINTSSPDKAADNLKFLLDAGLISDPRIHRELRAFIKHRPPGTGPSFPTTAVHGGLATLTVNARGPTAGTLATTGPVVIDVHVALIGESPPQLRVVGSRMPPGFTIVRVPSCDANALRRHGSRACVTSKLGTGKASAYVPDLGSTVTTRELSIFRGVGDGIILYARIDTAIAGIRTVLLPGVLGGPPTDPPLLKFQLDKIGMGAALTSADITLTQGLQAGPCPTGSWTFRAQLEFAGAPPARTTTSVQCSPK